MIRRSLLSLLAATFALWWQAPAAISQTPTPFQQETGLNTAACNTSNPQPYCHVPSPLPAGPPVPAGFPVGPGPWNGGWRDHRTGIVTPVINPGVGDYGNAQGYLGNVSMGRGSPPWPDYANPGDIHNLLYPGNTTKVFAAIQHWFSNNPVTTAVISDPAPGGGTIQQVVDVAQDYGGHKVTGYSINDSAYTDAMAADLWNRGFDGVIANVGTSAFTCAKATLASGKYNGQPDNFTEPCQCNTPFVWTDQGLQKLQQSMLRYSASQFQFAMQIDQGDFQYPATCGCATGTTCGDAPTDYFQAQCIRDKLKAELAYYANGDPRTQNPPCGPPNPAPAPAYFQAGNYLTPMPNSPVVQFFIDEGAFMQQCSNSPHCALDGTTCNSSAACWKAIWSDLRDYAVNTLKLTPYFVFKGTGSTTCLSSGGQFQHVQADGCYLWTSPQQYPGTSGVGDQGNWGQSDYLDPNYLTWANNPGVTGANTYPALFFGGAWKGMDDRFWNPGTAVNGLVMSQRCGQTWLDTFAEPGTFFSPGKQLDYLLVATYDDHEAGTQFQTGIDNCASVAASITGSILSWNTTFSDSVNGSPSTLFYYRLFDSPDGASVTVLLDGIPPDLSGALDISGLPLPPGTHMLYLKLVGKPGIFNKISGPMVAHTFSLAKTGNGSVSASHASLACDASCSTKTALHGHGTQITLTARAGRGNPFLGWGGACSGTAPTCSITLDAARSVTATFD